MIAIAKLYFRYSSMNSGKSTQLIQIAHNYEERGMGVYVLKPKLDTRQVGVESRIGLSRKADLFINKNSNIYNDIDYWLNHSATIDCILIDEAQFLTKEQIWQLTDIVDNLNIPVICFGLRTDFQGQLFEGSQWLLAWADDIQEIQTTSVCHCGKKARFVLRVDDNGSVVQDGEQIVCGGNDRYISVCRRHFKEQQIK